MPDLPLLLLGAPVLGLAANVLCQVVVSRLPLALGPVRRQFASFGGGGLVTLLGLGFVLPGSGLGLADAAGYFLLHSLGYAFAGFIFFNVINMNVSSLRVRILKEYLQVDPAPLAESVLREKYSARGMLAARLERLHAGHQLTRRNGRYYLQPGGVLVIAHIFAFLKRLLLRQ